MRKPRQRKRQGTLTSTSTSHSGGRSLLSDPSRPIQKTDVQVKNKIEIGMRRILTIVAGLMMMTILTFLVKLFRSSYPSFEPTTLPIRDAEHQHQHEHHPIHKEQLHNNQATRHQWTLYTTHRTIVTQIIREAGVAALPLDKDDSKRVILFGAGNLNDVNLLDLLKYRPGQQKLPQEKHNSSSSLFDAITLVDLDEISVQQGVQRQLSDSRLDSFDFQKKITVIPSLDLSNIIQVTTTWDAATFPSAYAYGQAWQAAHATPYLPASLRESFHVSVSLCLLSQLQAALARIMPEPSTYSSSSLQSNEEESIKFIQLVVAIRNRQIAQLVEALLPGGRGVLIVDFVSTETLPTLRQANDTSAWQVLTLQAEQEGNYFHGCKRHAVQMALQAHPDIVPLSLLWYDPWKWTLSAQGKEHLVYAVSFQKKAVDDSAGSTWK